MPLYANEYLRALSHTLSSVPPVVATGSNFETAGISILSDFYEIILSVTESTNTLLCALRFTAGDSSRVIFTVI